MNHVPTWWLIHPVADKNLCPSPSNRGTSSIDAQLEIALVIDQISCRTQRRRVSQIGLDNISPSPRSCVSGDTAGQTAPANQDQGAFAAPELGIVNQQIKTIGQHGHAQQSQQHAARIVEEISVFLLVFTGIPAGLAKVFIVAKVDLGPWFTALRLAADDENGVPHIRTW